GATGDQVAAHQRAVVVSRYRGKPCTEAFQPDVRLCAKPQPKSKAQGFGPHGSEVAEIDEQRALTQQIGVRTGKKVNPLLQQVHRHGQRHARLRRYQRAVVADAQADARSAEGQFGTVEVAPDDIELVSRHDLVAPQTSSVRMSRAARSRIPLMYLCPSVAPNTRASSTHSLMTTL